ncbi:hypothetical protein JIG36_31530 [Actinoplanes sp. LDG1-06]|uniref:Uncharacterized protein n=1 Tax=Paractinoplanes ovalisporus TaxID=2810368 RepID=A0ABS2AJN5_9ACTN|nr:hypothetical protein [Actinoplanes ovalisporus]MBM2620054.1 hypothetical protein [Actinoplanes ovalisporus]
MDQRSEVRDFLTTRRGRITPERAGLPSLGRGARPATPSADALAMPASWTATAALPTEARPE